MSEKLLTQVITTLVNDYAVAKEYGVSLINIPDFDYSQFAKGISSKRNVQLFFLGFSDEQKVTLSTQLPDTSDSISFDFTVEAAEKSRNSGDENVFRILIIKRAEIEKISSLRWFPEITLEKIYMRSCSIVKSNLSNTNNVIEALIQALRCKPIRSILSFERVLSYLELLQSTKEKQLPFEIKENFYKLGLCADKNIDSNNPSKDDFVARIRKNHKIIERIGDLEQSERQSITNYYSKDKINKDIPRLILSYYKTKNIELLKEMDLSDVEECLKAVKRNSRKAPKSKSKNSNAISPTSLAAQLIFDNNQDQINDVLDEMSKEIDKYETKFKAGKFNININEDIKLQIKTEPSTERIALNLTDEDYFGGVIKADVQTPSEAIKEIGKYKSEMFKKEYLDIVWNNLSKIADLLKDGETISMHLKNFLEVRNKLVPFRKRLQDAPMLQVLAKYSLFSDYLNAYERLLNSINDEFPRIWDLAPSNAKEIINIIMSLDYIFVIGDNKYHAIPTPLHPLYLWKYIELSKEILTSKGIDNSEDCHLSEDDKAFIIRKSDDIPDPLSVILLPVTIANNNASFLPFSGRLGMLPVYSNQPQINQSESGIDILNQQIIRYLCLYPHAGMMLKLTIIDPPSVETVVAMLKALNNDKDFNIFGIEVTIFRTKEVPNDWIEIEDESLNDGMLGKYKGKRNLTFKLKIASKRYPYSQILSEMQQQHLVIVFDPNEVKVDVAQNSKHIHIHPLCVPKIYKYNPVDEKIEIRPASEGGIFTTYASIIEKLNERPSAFSHTGTYFKTPLKRETYDSFLEKTDWLIILDQNLKSWDISLRAASEKLFYRENSYRSIGVYSNNCCKFIVGYDTLVKQLGNFIPNSVGIKNIIKAIRAINDDGLLSIVSHTSNRIFDTNHGKGSLGTGITALKYIKKHPKSLIVGLDTQLAQEWLADRDDGKLPDLIAINLEENLEAIIDVIEVKTYSNNINSFVISDNKITGHAVEQAAVLEELIKEMFGSAERITTISRREILREQVFDSLFQADMSPAEKRKYADELNELFVGQYKITINKNISFIDFDNLDSSEHVYKGTDKFANDNFNLMTTGSVEIQALLTNVEYTSEPKFNVNYSSKPYVSDSSNYDSNTNLPSDISISDEETTIEDKQSKVDLRALEEKCIRINKVFRDYKINAHPVNVKQIQEAARFTRFSVELKSGESIRSIEKYKADIGRQLEADGEILINHIKGTKYISVDVPFAGADSSIKLTDYIHLLDNSSGRLNVIAGQSADGKIDILDIAGAPHMLVAGTTGSGKTVFLHSIIISLLHQFSSDELELLIIDPKQTDFIYFEEIPHLYGGKVVIDAEDALIKLQKINTNDKETRTANLRSCRSKDIDSYNQKNPNNKMKRLVIIIDEYADLIQAAEMQGTRKDFEKNLLMLLQRVRNLGIHLIIATQRPSAQIVTGALKAVIPFRVSFRLPSHTDSQTILDMSGAETLLGKGDMLMVTENDTKRLQGLYISEEELEEFIEKL